MAKNKPYGDGRRLGFVKQRSQTLNPKTGLWVKRDSGIGQFVNHKADKNPFKGVRKEK